MPPANELRPMRGQLWVNDQDGKVYRVDKVWTPHKPCRTYVNTTGPGTSADETAVSALWYFVEHFTPWALPPVTVYRHTPAG